MELARLDWYVAPLAVMDREANPVHFLASRHKARQGPKGPEALFGVPVKQPLSLSHKSCKIFDLQAAVQSHSLGKT